MNVSITILPKHQVLIKKKYTFQENIDNIKIEILLLFILYTVYI